MNKLLVLILLLTGSSVFSQIAPDIYLVEFTDKANSNYSLNSPEEFLSKRAVNRRDRYQIPITEIDLPVNQSYIDGILKFGPKVHTVSKWFNSVSIITNNMAVLDSIRSLPYVRAVKQSRISSTSPHQWDKLDITPIKSEGPGSSFPDSSYFNYGSAGPQTGMLNGHVLHNQGFQGQGMVIAVLDGGFTGADNNPAFDSLWKNNQILGTWDFVNRTPVRFSAHAHGAQVLSIMAANIPGRFVGTAPKAGYYLLRTEDGAEEYPVEEDNWISAAEFADSAGVDLINSSLKYTTFDDSTMNHTYEDMDGNTTRISRAADIAASRGILVVSAAGNEGSSQWKYIGAPADADSILTVGAVDAEGLYAYFSSIGPTSNGNIKPNLSAQGKGTSFAGTDGNIYQGNGTSFSSPVMCGLAACLWQSKRSLHAYDLIQLMQESGSQAQNPDYYLGYGLPDFSQAFFVLQGIDPQNIEESAIVNVFPNPFYGTLNLDYFTPKSDSFVFEIWDMRGRLIIRKEYEPGFSSFKRIKITDLEVLNPGLYITRIISEGSVTQARIMKQRIRQ